MNLDWLVEALAPFKEQVSAAYLGQLHFLPGESKGGCIHKPNGEMAWSTEHGPVVRVAVAWPEECKHCHGEDPYGSSWCPLCEYCCGC